MSSPVIMIDFTCTHVVHLELSTRLLVILFSPRILSTRFCWQLSCRGWGTHLCHPPFSLELVYRCTSQKRSLVIFSRFRSTLAIACFVDILNRGLFVLCLFSFSKPSENSSDDGD